jgi:uncharacterized membrane protein
VALLGCSSASDTATGLRTTTDQHGPALPADGSGFSSTEVSSTEVSVDSEEPPAVDGNAVDVCPASADFVPLGVVPEEYNTTWKAVDPRAGYAYWTYEYTGDDVRLDHYRWTASGGVERLLDLLRLPAVTGESRTYLEQVSLDGRVILGSRVTDDDYAALEIFRYAPDTGTVALDFYPRALSQDGQVALDVRGGRPLRWTAQGGATELALPSEMQAWNFDSAQFWSFENGDMLLGAGVLDGAQPHVVRWTAGSGWVNLGLLPEGAGAPERIALTVSEAGDAIVGTLGNPAEGGSRVFRWTESSGSTELGALAGLPADTSYMVTHLSADGSVVVGSAQTGDALASHVFRWTEALGMQDLMPGVADLNPAQMSTLGDVVIAHGATLASTNTHRWTRAGGVETLDLYLRGASANGNLLVGARDGQPVILAFDPSGSAPPSLAELAPPTVVPADWTQAYIDYVSADGHLVVGTARDPQGEREAWLLRRVEHCPAR